MQPEINDFLLKAREGDAGAQFAAGRALVFGEGADKDERAGTELWIAAATAGHSGAQYALGEYFYARKDYYEAVRWYVLAAGQNHQDALRMLADCYLHGLGTAKDEIKAQLYKRKANELYEQEKFDRKNPHVLDKNAEAALMRDYNEKKDGESITNLAAFFYAKENFAQCAKWAKDGASSGVTDCVLLLAKLCENGQGVPVDYKRAKALFLLAHKDGSADAAEEIASRFLNGNAVFKKSKSKAAKWYAIAAKSGSKTAVERLRELNPKLAEKTGK